MMAEPSAANLRAVAVAKLKRAASFPRMKDGHRCATTPLLAKATKEQSIQRAMRRIGRISTQKMSPMFISHPGMVHPSQKRRMLLELKTNLPLVTMKRLPPLLGNVEAARDHALAQLLTPMPSVSRFSSKKKARSRFMPKTRFLSQLHLLAHHCAKKSL